MLNHILHEIVLVFNFSSMPKSKDVLSSTSNSGSDSDTETKV